ncbi:type-F conjugative transfer system pilin assembly protein TrbC [Hydrogenovibrio marinus]|uniref:Type-F conjugative transfer system pilin assembly protein TrbC n=1 Tax=Hydrogenovibrio marinus TaxID=28885 RepID=A0A066ZWL4_HYDMR|nr:type-F conjugative transfer system pilin assembly protein TrbC [Hydrogenovibrio marinus]KDN94716.1 hypothetical protein EI16_12530 [Hydrogenovibrio marinus]
MKNSIILISILSALSMNAMAQDKVNISTGQIKEAQKRAEKALAKMPQNTALHFDWSKVPQPRVHYNGNLASSAISISGLNDKVPLASINPKKKIKVFVSFSMPEESIRRYAEQAKYLAKGDVVLVLNGLDKSKNFPKTIQHMRKVVKGTGAEFDLDPPSFVRFGVKQVPAIVVYTDDPMYEAKCAIQGKRDNLKKMEHFVGVYGDVSIAFALDYLDNTYPKSEFTPFIESSLHKLRGLK